MVWSGDAFQELDMAASMEVMPNGEFDYVVVGAGSAGCVAAARLSESGKYRVALLEAGGEDNSFWIHTPIGFGKLYEDPEFNWLYESEPEPELEGARVFQPRGKVLGGSGSINGMVYTRGQHDDFDHWRKLGNPGWGYDDVLPYFKKAEDNEGGANAYRALGGPLRISNAPKHELVDAFIAAGVQAGYPRNQDFNGAHEEGFGYNQLTTRRGRRWSTADGYLHPVRKRSNLQVITEAFAARILFKNGEAAGVEFKKDGVTRAVLARREVILCLGAFNSPQLLQLSGVGPASLMRKMDIPVVVDLPGVGANLQDHFGPAMVYRCTRPITMSDVMNNPVRRIATGLQYILFHKGLMTTNASFGAACIRTDSALPGSDIRLKLALWGRAAAGRSTARKNRLGLLPFSSFSVLMALQHPESCGSVRIKSPDPSAPPAIQFNYLAAPGDRLTCLKAMHIIRRVMSMPAMTPYVSEEITPVTHTASDDALIEFCRQRGRSTLHASCTCKMGTDYMAVVDARLRVRGMRRLRVMDASIMPRIVGSNPNAAVIMIAEKGSAMVLEDAEAAPARHVPAPPRAAALSL
jgi:choline dehydrogenase